MSALREVGEMELLSAAGAAVALRGELTAARAGAAAAVNPMLKNLRRCIRPPQDDFYNDFPKAACSVLLPEPQCNGKALFVRAPRHLDGGILAAGGR